jgi:hypothetical protein
VQALLGPLAVPWLVEAELFGAGRCWKALHALGWRYVWRWK